MTHDCAAARQLSTAAGFTELGAFCQRIWVANFEILGEGEAAGPNAATYTATLTINAGSAVLAEGEHTIFLTLARQSDGAWRVTGGGTAP